MNKETGEVFYVGSGLKYRPIDTSRRSKRWRAYVKENPEWEHKIDSVYQEEELARARESELIAKFKPALDGGTLCNVLYGSETPSTNAHVKAELSSICKERYKKGGGHHPNLSKALSKRMRSNKNPMKSATSRKKLSVALKGLKRSKKTCELNGKAHSIKVSQYSKEDVLIQVFSSGREAAKAIGCTATLIGMACRGKIKTAKGYKWRYTDGAGLSYKGKGFCYGTQLR